MTGSGELSSVGEHFLVGLRPTTTLDARDRALLTELRPAGVVLFKSNFRHDLPYQDWLAVHARLLEDVRSAIGRERILVAIDHEGGRVCRTPAPLTRFPMRRTGPIRRPPSVARWASSSPRSASI